MANTVTAKGSAVISINPSETEARLVFVPDAEGEEWDAAAIIRLAVEKQIASRPEPKVIETFLSKASRAKTPEPIDLVICRGTEPEDPVGEKIKWEAPPVPGDMAPFEEEVLGGAKAPEIYRVSVEKIKVEKKIKKPGPLPFMPGKEEISVTWEKKEIREKIEINPRVLEVKFTDKGKKIGTLVPSVPGKAGKSVFGRPLPPGDAANETFLHGEGIARDKNELSAMISGFIRIGENWADIVPMSKPSWSVNTGIDGLTLFFRFEPGDAHFVLPSGKDILSAAAAKGAGEENMVSAEELDEAITLAAKSGEALEAFSLFRVREADARVEINQDKTRASLYLRKGVGGALPLEMKTISGVIKDSGVHGYDAEKLKKDIHDFMAGKEIELKDYLLAEGTPSTRGKDRDVQISAALLSADEQKQLMARLMTWSRKHDRAHEDFDPQKATGFAFIKKGDVAARVSSGSEGEAGKDIYGNVLPGLTGNDPEIKLFRGLEQHGSSIVASQNGLLLMEASEKTFRGGVIIYQDAKAEIHISEDNMEVRGDFFREEGAGVPLTVENILKVLAALGVKNGIDREAAEKACALAKAKGAAPGKVLARGEAPVTKGGTALKWLVSPGPAEFSGAGTFGGEDRAAEPAGESVQIKAGEPLAVVSGPFAEGRPGFDVKGTELPIDNGISLTVEHDDSIREESAGNTTRLIAVRSGELYFDGKAAKIISIKNIRGDAGPDGGTIRFSGELRISGNVLPGSVIIGGSHVIVGGVAEGAFISAGGKAVAAMGFKGGGRGIIRARAGIETAFTERGSIMAMGDILLKKGSIHSTIRTNGKLRISSENGKLSGGICQVKEGIDAADMGSEKGVLTEISFGQDYLIKDRLDACEEEMAGIRNSLSETDEKAKAALQKKLPFPEEIRREKIRLVKLLEQLKIKIFTLREKFEEYHESEVRIRGAVFPGVVIESHGRYYEIQQKRSQVIFYFDRETGRIKEKPLD